MRIKVQFLECRKDNSILKIGRNSPRQELELTNTVTNGDRRSAWRLINHVGTGSRGQDLSGTV